jgi:hypothetical protein
MPIRYWKRSTVSPAQRGQVVFETVKRVPVGLMCNCSFLTDIQQVRSCYGPREGYSVDDRLKELMQELGNAINESLSDSDRIAGAIGEIKQAGYDVFLVLEATIGFNKREDSEESATDTESTTQRFEPGTFEPGGKVKWTSQDHKFLKALKIAVDEEVH